MQKITEELYLDDGRRTYRIHSAVKDGCIVEAGRYYAFELWRDQVEFDGVAVDRFVMKPDDVYARDGAQSRNYEVIVEHFWAQCFQALSVFEDDVQDSYILAKLLPYVRRNGSRRVFRDAILAPPKLRGTTKLKLLAELEQQLAASCTETLSITEFHKQTGKLLGPPEITPQVEAEYQGLAEELLGAGRKALGRWGADGLQAPISKLQHWMNGFFRHRGHEERKLALDMLSYECRAALHRCYSAVWDKLLLHLEKKYELDVASVQYHRLMHFDVIFPSNLAEANFHLFHGHVFALHPGLDLCLQTKTGAKLMGDYLRCNSGDQPFCRLMHGFCVALCNYDLHGEHYAQDRKRSSRFTKVPDAAAVDAAQTKGRGHRRLPGPKRDDSRDDSSRVTRRTRKQRSES